MPGSREGERNVPLLVEPLEWSLLGQGGACRSRDLHRGLLCPLLVLTKETPPT